MLMRFGECSNVKWIDELALDRSPRARVGTLITTPDASLLNNPVDSDFTDVFQKSMENNYPLVQVMAWRQRGDKPMSELMMTQFTDAYIS